MHHASVRAALYRRARGSQASPGKWRVPAFLAAGLIFACSALTAAPAAASGPTSNWNPVLDCQSGDHCITSNEPSVTDWGVGAYLYPVNSNGVTCNRVVDPKSEFMSVQIQQLFRNGPPNTWIESGIATQDAGDPSPGTLDYEYGGSLNGSGWTHHQAKDTGNLNPVTQNAWQQFGIWSDVAQPNGSGWWTAGTPSFSGSVLYPNISQGDHVTIMGEMYSLNAPDIRMQTYFENLEWADSPSLGMVQGFSGPFSAYWGFGTPVTPPNPADLTANGGWDQMYGLDPIYGAFFDTGRTYGLFQSYPNC